MTATKNEVTVSVLGLMELKGDDKPEQPSSVSDFTPKQWKKTSPFYFALLYTLFFSNVSYCLYWFTLASSGQNVQTIWNFKDHQDLLDSVTVATSSFQQKVWTNVLQCVVLSFSVSQVKQRVEFMVHMESEVT